MRIKFECNVEGSKNLKIKVSCKICNHIWKTSVRNAVVFPIACYNCHKGKGYSMDELKILNTFTRFTFQEISHLDLQALVDSKP